jgi:hypothetical protein
VLVSTLRGLYEAGDFNESDLRTGFETAWFFLDHEHELRTEPWGGPESTEATLNAAVSKMMTWVDDALKNGELCEES